MPLTLHILKWLRAAGDNSTPEEQLRMDLRLSVVPTPTGVQINDALNQLLDKGWAIDARDEVTTTVRWMITQPGLDQLSKRKL